MLKAMKKVEDIIILAIICNEFDLKKVKYGTQMVAMDALCNAINSKN
jgi:hypothetical protein